MFKTIKNLNNISKASRIIAKMTGQNITKELTDNIHDKNATGMYSNEYELVLIYFSTRIDPEKSWLYPNVTDGLRMSVMELYKKCEGEGLVKNSFIRDEYLRMWKEIGI